MVARDLPLETTSAVAAALWYPYRAYPFERVTAWAATTYAELARLAADEKTGVSMRPGTEVFRGGATPTPWWASAVPDLRPAAGLPTGYASGFTSTRRWWRCRSTSSGSPGASRSSAAPSPGWRWEGCPTSPRWWSTPPGSARGCSATTDRCVPGPRPGGVRRAGWSGPVVAGQRRTDVRRAAEHRHRARRLRGGRVMGPGAGRGARQGHPGAGARAGARAPPGEGARAPGRPPAGEAVSAAGGGHRADGGAGRALLRARWSGCDAGVGVRGRGRGAGGVLGESRWWGSSMPRRAS